MKNQKLLSTILLFILSTGPFAGCGLFNPEGDTDLEIMTDQTTYSPGDSIVVTIRNTGSETVHYNSCQQSGLIAMRDNKAVEEKFFEVEDCFMPTPFKPNEISVRKFQCEFITFWAQRCTSRVIDQYRLYFEYYHDGELQNRLPAKYLQSNSFSLDSLDLVSQQLSIRGRNK